MRVYDPAILNKPTPAYSTPTPRHAPGLIHQPPTPSHSLNRTTTTTTPSTNSGNMTLSSKLSSSKPTPSRPAGAPIDHHDPDKDSSSRDPSAAQLLHSSAAAPRQSEAFKRLGQASLVSSSIFKSAPSTPKQPTSSAIDSKPAMNSQPPTASRTAFTPQRTPGSQSQMAAALKGLGIASHVLTPAETSRPAAQTRPLLKATPQGTKRKTDENLPVPPRPPPNLPSSSPPSQTMDRQASNQKARPPRQSLAFNALTRNALVTSSPFKASSSPAPLNKLASNSIENLGHRSSASPSATPIVFFSEGDEASSHDSDIAPGTPSSEDPRAGFIPASSSPRPTGASNGVLKIQRLGGPRSFTPPQSPHHRYYASESETSNMVRRAPSALSSTGRRRQRRKTVTWGGEDVLEFEWEEELRRNSGTSSLDSVPPACDPKADDMSDLSSDLEVADPPHSSNDQLYSQPEPTWKRSSHAAQFDQDSLNNSSLQEDENTLDSGSIIVHDDSEVMSSGAVPKEVDDSAFLSVTSNKPPCASMNNSGELDPVEQMVNELLTSPDLAGHVTAQSIQPWGTSFAAHEQEPDSIAEIEITSDSDHEKTIEEQVDDAPPQPSELPSTEKKKSPRFPFINPVLPNPPSEQKDSNVPVVDRIEPSDPPIKNSSSVQAIPFKPISLPQLGLDDTLFDEGSMISSILESSTLEVQSLDTINLTATQPMRSSTPRASFTNQLPDPNPPSPNVGPASPPVQTEVQDTLPTTVTHASPRRPLPQPPPVSPSPPIPHDARSAFPTPTTSSYNLPDVPHTSPFPSTEDRSRAGTSWVRPTSASITSESDAGCESGLSSPGGTKQRITRQKIHNRMRDRDGISKSGNESVDVVPGTLTRGQTSHSASIHKLGFNGEEEKLELAAELSLNSDTPSTATIGPVKEIQARPPMRAQQVTLSEPTGDDDRVLVEESLKSPEMGTISSGLDKLAQGFQGMDDSKSCDSSGSVSKPYFTDTTCLPSKLIMVKGAGRRRRSLSTGGADLEETGTGSGAKAVVKSTVLKRHSMAVEKASQITSGLLYNSIQPAMAKTDFQDPLNQVLKKANNLRSYNVYESDEIVVASDHTVTAGAAGDVAANQNWRKVRKVSDINQHAAQLKQFWAQNENVSKVGRVFVKITKLVFRGVPLSQPPAHFQVIIDNGLHKVKTPLYKLEPEVSIGIEFELVRANKLEFKLAFSVPLNLPQNAHLKPPLPPQPLSPPRPLSQSIPVPVPTSPKRLFGFLGASSKRQSKQQQQLLQEKERQLQREKDALTRQLASQRTTHPLVSLLNRNHVLATALVNFEQYARESLGAWKVAVVPCMSALEDPVKAEMQMRRTFTGPIGQVNLEFLLLPPIPKLPNTTFPDSGSECLKGLQIAEWWQQVWHEGVLSQLGADCLTWKRRTFKATGGSLFAYNDIMKKISAEIRLTEVVSLQDCGNGVDENEQPKISSISDQGEILPPFTFRLLFKDESEIFFHADNQADFKRWKNVLKPLIGKIQPLPAWAELLRLQIAAKRAALPEEEDEKHESIDSDTESQQYSRPIKARVPGRSSQPSKLSSQASTTSTITSGRSSNYPPTLSTLPSDTSYLPSSEVHRHRLSPNPSHIPHRLSPSMPPSDTSSAHRPPLSHSVSTASSVLSKQTTSTSTTSVLHHHHHPPSLLPVKSQMKRSHGPIKFH